MIAGIGEARKSPTFLVTTKRAPLARAAATCMAYSKSAIPSRSAKSIASRATVGDSHEANQLADEGADIRTAARRRDEAVEVRQGVPRDERTLRARLQAIEQFGSRAGERLTVERHIDQYVRVDQDQRYFRANAS